MDPIREGDPGAHSGNAETTQWVGTAPPPGMPAGSSGVGGGGGGSAKLHASSASARGDASGHEHAVGGALHKLECIPFDNFALRELPVDPIAENYVRKVAGAVFSRVKPLPVDAPVCVCVSQPALALLDVDPAEVNRPDFAAYFAGNKLLPGVDPAAHCYCGHQFGAFSGQLGDGATMFLGQMRNSRGEIVELQFKGAGKTPYSRTADGRKVLRSSLREFLCSELMAALGIPTTRAATVVTSDTKVQRDVYYTGDVIEERATIITRLAPTFLRFGSFEICRNRDPMTGREGPSMGNLDILRTLLDFTCKHYYPDIYAQYSTQVDRWYHMFREIVARTARLVAQWQAYGWCHGVLNTDNMSILGLTLDYGPFGWMDRFDPEFICNASDNGGRYSYENQPAVCRWNCSKLAESIGPVMEDKYNLRGAVAEVFDATFKGAYRDAFRRKLGLGFSQPAETGGGGGAASATASVSAGSEDDDDKLIADLLGVMAATGADFTNTFRALMDVDIFGAELSEGKPDPVLEHLLTQCAPVAELAAAFKPRIPPQQLRMFVMLAQRDPRLAESLGEIEGELRRLERFQQLSARSEDDKRAEDRTQWQVWLQRYRARLVSEVTAEVATQHESEHAGVRHLCAARQRMMAAANPKYVLRNWVAHEAIQKAEAGDFSEVRRVLDRMLDPYGLRDEAPTAHDAAMTVPHLTAPNTADEGATRRPSGSSLEDVERGASAALGGTSAPESAPATQRYACRPPSWALDLKVT